MKKTILHLVHQVDVSAGTELYVDGLVAHLADDFLNVQVNCRAGPKASLVAGIRENHIALELPYDDLPRLKMNSLPEGQAGMVFSVASVVNAQVAELMEHVVGRSRPSLIHVHNLVGWPHLDLAFEAPHCVSIYDHFWICPDYFYVTSAGKRCLKPSARGNDHGCIQCVSDKARALPSVGEIQPVQFLERREIVMKRLIGEAASIVAPSAYMGQRIVDAGYTRADCIRTIPFGSELVDKLPEPARNRSRQERQNVAFVGNFSSHKGTDLFVALVRLCSDLPVSFFLIGSCSEHSRNDLQRLGVVCRGSYRVRNLPELLADMDVALILSRVDESYCMALDDVLACGVPLIATRVGALPERVQDGVNGFLVEENDVEMIRARLQWLHSHGPMSAAPSVGPIALTVPSRKSSYIQLAKMYAEILG